MHIVIYKKLEEILSKNRVKGRILEVGAVPSFESILNSPVLNNSTEKLGINIAGPSTYRDYKILKGNANNMEMFEDESFDCVICNATLEHDKFFWKSISEMRRILKKGGLLVIGVPSFISLKQTNNFIIKKLARILFKKLYNVKSKNNVIGVRSSTICMRVHNYPGDYYRFSEQTFRDVFFVNFKNVVIESIMIPPRTIAYGIKV